MIVETPKPLHETLDIPCYACNLCNATHVCRYHLGELVVQVCLCNECMQMDTQRLLNRIIGIQEHIAEPIGPLPNLDDLRFTPSRQTA
ncbi:MAG: hypothetical protein HKP58_06690 [Desulfatitalea sp.]|nr:hypothetical protein [Desulfatitalea sp.]NNK00085.1 hypothetical protein [Desulfatitalea sp.]